MFAELRRRLRVWFDRERLEREMSEELEVFLDLDAAERERAGVASERARRATMLEMGGLEQVKEALREQHPGVFLDILRQDVRYGLRMLLRRPGFTSSPSSPWRWESVRTPRSSRSCSPCCWPLCPLPTASASYAS